MEIGPTIEPYQNPMAKGWQCQPRVPDPAILDFHKTLPHYAPTPLMRFDGLAKSLGIRSLHVKDESERFGLPSFKILGASWAIYRAVCAKIDIEPTISLKDLSRSASKSGISLVTCSDGNWGRSVARMAKYLSIPATIFVPANIDQATQDKISSEGAQCLVCPGDYNASIQAAQEFAGEDKGALLVMDTSWEGYTTIPQWVTDGYSTMLAEVWSVVSHPTLAIVSVGVGSWAHSVVAHYKQQPKDAKQGTTVATVESVVAPSLLTSLHAGRITTIDTGDTIMCGMNCGTISDIAWPYLRDGVDEAVAITDLESHQAVQELRYQNDGKLNPGPCGAAPLSALKQLLAAGRVQDPEKADVVLFCTEGAREYEIPSQ